MGEAMTSTEASLHELRASLDLMHGNVARIDTTQQQLVAQMDLISAAVENGAKTNADVVRRRRTGTGGTPASSRRGHTTGGSRAPLSAFTGGG
jgi:hypothetical protein